MTTVTYETECPYTKQMVTREADFGELVLYMDNDLREYIHAICDDDMTEQEFLDAYCHLHLENHSEYFYVN